METNRIKEETIEKYYNALLELRNVLKYTNRISLDEFSVKNNLSKSLSKVLQKGGIIKCLKRGKYSEWEWTTIEPTTHMAVKTIQLLGANNQPRKRKTNIKESDVQKSDTSNDFKNKTHVFKIFGFKIYEKTTLFS